jgi:hypothetical protein
MEELGEEVDTQFSVSYLTVLQQYRRDRQASSTLSNSGTG